jgi:transcriptional regulator with XRE-family HTH domain
MILDDDVKKQFGRALKRWRYKVGISQEELAWRASLHRTYVSDIERGERNPSLESIEKLAKALNLSFSTLFQPLGEVRDLAGTTSPDK